MMAKFTSNPHLFRLIYIPKYQKCLLSNIIKKMLICSDKSSYAFLLTVLTESKLKDLQQQKSMLIWSDLQMRKCYINRNAYEFLILSTNALCAAAFSRSSFLNEHFN